jgi:hypothetical protein
MTEEDLERLSVNRTCTINEKGSINLGKSRLEYFEVMGPVDLSCLQWYDINY